MRILSVIVLAMLLFGCGSSMNGNYLMYGQTLFTSCGGGGSSQQDYVDMTLSQNGNTVNGTFNSQTTKVTGTIQGTVNGPNYQFTFYPTSTGGSNTPYQANGTFNPGSVGQFTIANPNCGGAQATAQFYKRP